MGEEVFIVAIVFGTILSIVFLGIVGSIIKAWVKKDSGSLAQNQEFLAALREFKEKTDRRLSNLEAIVTDENPQKVKAPKKEEKPKEQKSAIEIELESEAAKEEGKESGKLRNMLNQ